MHLTFHDDLNIASVSSDIQAMLEDCINSRDQYEKYCKYYKIIAMKSHNPSDRLLAAEKYAKLMRIYPMIKSGTLVTEYKKRTGPYLEQYAGIAGTSRVFGMDSCSNVPKRVGIILNFLSAASNFIELTWTCTYNMEKVCPLCYRTMRKCPPLLLCDCGYSHVIVVTSKVRIEDGKIRSPSSYKAEKNFLKEFKHVCGLLHSCQPGEKEDIESHLYRSGIHEPTRDNIRASMHACGYNNYNDTNYIYSSITKTPLPPLDRYVDVCISRFKSYYNVFQSIEKEGKNITNIHILIQLFLWQEDIPYEKDWFRKLSPATEAKHIRNIRKVCEILSEQEPDGNWKYPPEWDNLDASPTESDEGDTSEQ